jgi:hypothetical protein
MRQQRGVIRHAERDDDSSKRQGCDRNGDATDQVLLECSSRQFLFLPTTKPGLDGAGMPEIAAEDFKTRLIDP